MFNPMITVNSTGKPIWFKTLVAGFCSLFLLMSLTAQATTYYVDPNGINEPPTTAFPNRGKSPSQPWKTLAFACQQIPVGSHTILLAGGIYYETENIYPKAGLTIQGNGSTGTNKTTLVAPLSWNYSANMCTNAKEGYLFVLESIHNVSIRNMEIIDSYEKKVNGAVYADLSNYLTLHNLVVTGFRFAGVFVKQGNNLNVQYCTLKNSAKGEVLSNGQPDKEGYCGASDLGSLTMQNVSHSQIHHNTFISDRYQGYGIRGRSMTNTKIYQNNFNLISHFDLEIAHEEEFGVEVYENTFRRAVSVPKSASQQDPNNKGYAYSIRIHDNTSYAKYAIEGSRNHLEIDHNTFHSTSGPQGRIYTDFGANCPGPVWIHHNVAFNVNLAFIYKEHGRLDNVYLYHNTVYMKGSDPFIHLYATNDAKDIPRNIFTQNWFVQNNVIITPSTLPAGPFIRINGTAQASTNIPQTALVATFNVYQNVSGIPSGNFNQNPGLDPSVGYVPTSASSFVVDRGLDLPYSGPTDTDFIGGPDIGAKEFTPSGEITVQNGAVYELIPQNATAKRLDVTNGGSLNGTNVQLFGPTNSDRQRWRVIAQGKGFYELIPQCATDSRLAVNISSLPTNVYIWQADVTNSASQRWRLLPQGNGIFELAPQFNLDKRLDVLYAQTSDGTNVQVTGNNDNTAQRWSFTPVVTGLPTARIAAYPTESAGEPSGLLSNYPNPCKGQTRLFYRLPAPFVDGELIVYTTQGRELFHRTVQEQGEIFLELQSQGIYFCVLQVNGRCLATRKIYVQP